MIEFVTGALVGFCAGVLVYRRNKKHAEAIIRELKAKGEGIRK